MAQKSEHVQIRVTPREKAALRRAATAAGQDLSSYLLARALPSARARFEELLDQLAGGGEHRYVLAELNDLLSGLGAEELRDAVAAADPGGLSPFLGNYVAAMVERACELKDVSPPAWTARVEPLEQPWYATSLKSLRLHLLRSSPVPFKRRNLFVDASVGDRV